MLTRMWIENSGRPTLRNRGPLGTAVLMAVLGAAGTMLAPRRLRLTTVPVVLHALSFRGASAVALGVAGTTGLLSARVRGHGRRPAGPDDRSFGRPRPWRRLVGGTALCTAAMVNAAVVVSRGWAARPVPGPADLVVVSLNTLGGEATPAQIAALVSAELRTADMAVVALPETTAELAAQCCALLEGQGTAFRSFSTDAEPGNPLAAISLLIDVRLGPYRQVPAPQLLLGAVVAESEAGAPTLVAVHPGAPMPAVGFRRWRSDVAATVKESQGRPYSLMAGDFNTTVDHLMMQNLLPAFDAATRAGRGAEGTWPAHFPAPLSAPIDHVLVNGSDLVVLSSRTERVGGSDHRAVIVRLRDLRRAGREASVS